MEQVNRTVFTLGRQPGAEDRIRHDQEIVTRAVEKAVPEKQMKGLILAGGYGRREGGYRKHGEKYFPMNDYDYFIVIDGSKEECLAFHEKLVHLGHELTREVGVEVDFFVLRHAELPRLEYSLMYAELKWGHVVLLGDPLVLADMAPMPLEGLDLSEFSRLLMNRGSLLLLNSAALGKNEVKGFEAREEFARYLDKAIVACADVRLAVAGTYNTSVLVRQEKLAELTWEGDQEFREDFHRAMDSRYGPEAILIPEGQERAVLDRVVGQWLQALSHLETARLGSAPVWSSYAMPRVSKGQGRKGLLGIFRNLLVNIRDFGLKESLKNIGWIRRYPRERLLSVLPGLLNPALEVPLDAQAKALAVGGAPDRDVLIQRYLQLWGRYS